MVVLVDPGARVRVADLVVAPAVAMTGAVAADNAGINIFCSNQEFLKCRIGS